MAAEAVESYSPKEPYSPETIERIGKLHGRLANYLSTYGKPDFAQLGVTEGEGDRVFENHRELTDLREATYNTPVIGGVHRFKDAVNSIFTPFDTEGLYFYVGVKLEALEDVARKSSLKRLVAHYKKHGSGIVLRSIKPDLPSNPDDIFRTRWWETETLKDYPVMVSFVNINLPKKSSPPEIFTEALNRKVLQVAFLIMPPGPHITESGIVYFIPAPDQQDTPFSCRRPLNQDILMGLSRLPRVLGQRQKDLAA